MIFDLGKAVYNNFIKGYCMIRKKYLKDFELQEAYNIISSNMSKLGFVIKKRRWSNLERKYSQ